MSDYRTIGPLVCNDVCCLLFPPGVWDWILNLILSNDVPSIYTLYNFVCVRQNPNCVRLISITGVF